MIHLACKSGDRICRSALLIHYSLRTDVRRSVRNRVFASICEINLSQQRGDFPNLEKDFATNLATNRGLAALQRALQNRSQAVD